MRYYPPTGSTDPNAAYVGKNPAIGQQGSKVPPRAIEHTMRELVAIIAGAGLTPDENNTSQVWQALQAMDPSTFRTVSGSPIVSPPASPANGDEYAVQSPASGDWSGKDGQIARWDANSAMWRFSQCRAGRVVKVSDTDTFYRRTGAGWSSYTFGANVNPSVAWGGITGVLGDQSDLSSALAGKLALAPASNAPQTVAGSISVRVGANAYLSLEPGPSPVLGGALAAYTGAGVRVGYSSWWNGSKYVAAWTDVNAPVVIGANGSAWVEADGAGRVFFYGETRIKTTTYPRFVLEATGNAAGLRKWQSYLQPDGSLRIASLSDAENSEPGGAELSIGNPVSFVGHLAANGSPGGSSQVLAGGPTAHWANVIDLITPQDIRSRVGGRIILALGTFSGSATVTFTAAEQDTAYQGIVLAWTPAIDATEGGTAGQAGSVAVGSISAKTLNGCQVNGDAQGTGDIGLYIIYR